MAEIMRARARGARVIVIDHRRTETAKKTGAQWIAVRPGTDGALALAMIATLVEEDLYDRQFAEKWTVGFEDLRRYVASYAPEAAESVTGGPRERDSTGGTRHRPLRGRLTPQLLRAGVFHERSAEHPRGHDPVGTLRQP